MARCALESLLSAGGPVRVTVRPCCLAALVGRGGPSPVDAGAEARALAPVDAEAGASEAAAPFVSAASFVCAAADVELQVAQ
jgi:hypothetical protein